MGAWITLVSHPIRYDGEVPSIRLPPHKLRAQSEDILKEIGYDTEQVKSLRARGIICART